MDLRHELRERMVKYHCPSLWGDIILVTLLAVGFRLIIMIVAPIFRVIPIPNDILCTFLLFIVLYL